MELFPFHELWFKIPAGLLFGLVLGSFTTMLSYRLPRGYSIVAPPSSCPKCGVRLSVRDLVPVFSWIAHKGRCRFCGKKIGVRYLLIELAVTILATISFVVLGFSLLQVPALILIVALTTIATIGLEKD